jgi:hypothetical protein
MWESIDDYTERMRVPGGWLVVKFADVRTLGDGVTNVAVAMAFVPDLNHEWAL